MNRYLPTGPGLVRETLTVLGGAILAAAIISQFPALKRWIRDSWS